MAAQVSRAQTTTTGGHLFFKKESCQDTRVQKVMNLIHKQFPEFMMTTEQVLGRKIQVRVVDEDLKIAWNLDQHAIKINRKYCQMSDETGLLHDILFEVQNAQYTNVFSSYFARIGEFDIETFVQVIEWTEWRTTVKTIERLQRAGIPDEKIILSRCYYEFFDLFYLQQQLEGHSQQIAERYLKFGGQKHRAYQITWKVPFVMGSLEHRLLKELIADHLQMIRTGEGKDLLEEKIEILESGSNPGLDRRACEKALANFKWFTEKYQNLVEGNQS